MTEKQYDLTERMDEEYAEYLEDLLKTDKQTIISMSDRTTFYFALWGGEDEYRFNAKTGTYEYIDNEEAM